MTTMTEARTWTLEIPAPAEMFTENSRHHWSKTGPAVKALREASFVYAKKARLPKGLARVRIDVELHFTDSSRRRDRYNLHRYVAKPLVDGLAAPRTVRGKNGFRAEPGYLLIPGDDDRFLDGPFITIGEPVDKRRFPLGLAVITITDLSGEAHA